MTDTPITPAQTDALAKLAEIPAVGSEERRAWLEKAEERGLVSPDEHFSGWAASEYAVLALMSEARKQGQRDVLGAAPIARQAATDVLAERRRQVEAEGWTPEHDDEHARGELCAAAACYALASTQYGPEPADAYDRERERYIRETWPWSDAWWKPRGQRRDLVKAGALILAEIERLDRAALATGGARHG
jgi:hypothetical protein